MYTTRELHNARRLSAVVDQHSGFVLFKSSRPRRSFNTFEHVVRSGPWSQATREPVCLQCILYMILAGAKKCEDRQDPV